jgi:hydrogenase-4 component F
MSAPSKPSKSAADEVASMSWGALAVLIAFLASPGFALLGGPRSGALGILLVSGIVFLATLIALIAPDSAAALHGALHGDALGRLFAALSGFIGFSTAISNLSYVRDAGAKLDTTGWRRYHALYAVFLGAVLLGLYTQNLGLFWGAMEIATIAATLAVGLGATTSAIEAAWKYFILGGVGLAFALFGTMLLYLDASAAIGPGLPALGFGRIAAVAPHLDGALLTLAFVFLIFGYGTKAALVPLHGWLVDAHAEGPPPLTATLSTLTLNLALVGILRFRALLAANASAGGGAIAPGPILLALGLASLLLAGLSLWRRRNSRRFFGFSSIEHVGVATFAFGIGGATAIFGGLLHMILHTLAKTAVFQGLTRAAGLRGDATSEGFSFARLRGLVATSPALGWLLGGAVFTLAGMPPSGMFTSEFLIVSQTIQRQPWLSPFLGIGLVLGAIAIMREVTLLCFAPPPKHAPHAAPGGAIATIGVHLALIILLGFAMPGPLVRDLSAIATALR